VDILEDTYPLDLTDKVDDASSITRRVTIV